MDEEEKIQLIEDYLLQRLSTEQNLAFEQQLKNDPPLVKDLELHNLLLQGIELEGKLTKFSKHLNTLKTASSSEHISNLVVAKRQATGKTGASVKTIQRWIAGAAAVILLLVGSYWYLNDDSTESLYNKYYQVYPGSVQKSIVRGDTSYTLEEQAMQAYEGRNYQRAAALITSVIQTKPEDPDWPFYLGISYLELNDFKQAERYLKISATNPRSMYIKQAQWYLALSYVKNNQNAQAKEILNNLKLQTGVYSDKAKQLVEHL